MTRARILYVVLLAAALIFATVYTIYSAALFFLLLLMLPVLSLLYCLYIKSGVRCEVEEIQPICAKGQEIPLKVRIRNGGIFPAPRAELLIWFSNSLDETVFKKTILTALPRKAEKNLNVCLKSAYCGKLNVQVAELILYDGFSLVTAKRKLNRRMQTVVLPELHRVETETEILMGYQPDGDSYSPYKPGDDPSELFGIREFADGDSYRRVHWKLSIKQEKLMTKEFSKPIDDSVTLLVDLCVGDRSGYLPKVDALLEEAASLSVHLIKSGLPHRVCWYDGRREELFELKIERESDLYEALGGILESGIYRGRPAGVYSIGCKRCTRLFFFSPGFPEHQRESLSLLSDQLSIFYIDEAETGDHEYFPTELHPIILGSAREGLNEA